MTTSTIKTETFENITTVTEYSFKVFATLNKAVINDITVVVDEDCGEAFVWYHDTCNNYTSKQKYFSDSDDAHYYAMKLIKKLKDEIK